MTKLFDDDGLRLIVLQHDMMCLKIILRGMGSRVYGNVTFRA